MLRFLITAALCGWSSGSVAMPPMPDHRIVGGVDTPIADHPHQVAIQLNGVHNCGGSIIYASWVVTSAACVSSYPSAYTVSVGSTDIYGGKKYAVKNIAVHPQYSSITFDYNIALVEIYGPFEFNATIQPIQLATHEPPADTIVNVTGWGSLTESGGNSPRLLQVSVPIYDRNVCAYIWADSVNKITPRMICAGLDMGGKGPCFGDFGGPLSANGVLYGVFSWLRGCARPKYPGVYNNVANLRPWIRFVTGI